MKRLIYLIWMLGCMALTLQGCGSDSPVDELGGDNETPKKENAVTIKITTQVETKAAVVTTLGNGDEMNIYAKAYNRIDASDLKEKIKAVNKNGTWEMTPAVEIDNVKVKNAFIYAVYPYNEANTNPQAIAVDVTKQQDVLYSGSAVPTSYTTYTANLNMKHALSLVTFNISNQGYSGSGKLQAISINGDELYNKGNMNVSTGKIVGTEKGAISQNINKDIVNTGWTKELPRLWSIPFTTKAKRVTLQAKIDDKTFETAFPEVEMKTGFQYIFRLVLTDYGLEFIPNQTETISLNESTDEMEALQGYGVLKIELKGSTFRLPMLNGDNVFGSVNWGDGNNSSYTMGGEHTYTDMGTHQVIIESWNSTGFELKDLCGVEMIDISNY